MIAVFTFSVAELIYGIKDSGKDWVGPCTSEFVDTSPDSYPLRGDVRFLNSFPSEIGVKCRQDGSLNRALMTAGIDEKISEWRADGYPCASDAYVMRFWPQSSDSKELLGISVVLAEQKYSYFQEFMERHIGRADLSGRMICQFHGFNEPHQAMPDLPTKDEFLSGRHYFAVGDHSICFGKRLP